MSQTGSKISHAVIRTLYNTISWYNNNRGAGKAGIVLSYYGTWRELHALTVNISDDGWKAIRALANNMNITLTNRDNEWMFLFAIETYLHLFVRALALSKLGRLQPNARDFMNQIFSLRNIFEPSLFEWVFEACTDTSLPLRHTLEQNIDVMLQILYNLNTTVLTTDVFRELYQNILPAEIRRSLGEFYTKEDVVDEVLDAANLNDDAITNLYNRWKKAKEGVSGNASIPIILDPACGSGSFLLRVVDRAFKALGCRPDIANFLEDTIVGIDINPFAVEMARLNLILKLTDNMYTLCKAAYTPTKIGIYWGDSLAKFNSGINVMAQPRIVVKVPAFKQILDKESIDIPMLQNVGALQLVDLAYTYVKSGKTAQEFVDYISKISPTAVSRYNELTKFYEDIKRIHEAGNERLIELLKNTIVISSLIGSCDYVIGNPPWVRIHRVAKHILSFLKENYRYFGPNSTYDPRFRRTKTPFGEQHDYAIAFVERGLEFLREGGTLSYVITSKIARAMYAGALREDLVKNYKILEIRDYSLYPVPLFQDAVNYPLVISIKKEKPDENHKVKITVANTVGGKKGFEVSQNELPLNKNDCKSPWLLVPQNVTNVYRKIACKSSRLGDIYEVHRGVMTSADDIFIGKIKQIDCNNNTALVEFNNGALRYIELQLLHPFVRGRDIDPFSFTYSDYIVFTHDVNTFDPLWDADQMRVLQTLNLLRQGIRVSSAGGAVVYSIPIQKEQNAQNILSEYISRLNTLRSYGYNVEKVVPCAVRECYRILKDNVKVLDIRFDIQGNVLMIYVEGLNIPAAPRATQHFISNLKKLLGRDDYRAHLPPWTLFRVIKSKFNDYRIAWQEMAKHFETCILPVKISVNECGDARVKIVIPHETVYFIVEPSRDKAVKLLLYLNSDFVQSLLKLWAWSARGGYYRHVSVTVGHLPLPFQLLQGNIWNWLENYIKDVKDEELNKALEGIFDENRDRLIKELIQVLDISEEEYKAVVEWGTWLNELGPLEETPPLEEEELEEE